MLFPTLDFNSGYNYNKTDTPSSSTTLNRSNGFYWGFSLNVPIFSRLQNRTKIKNAKLELENTELSYQEAEKETLGDLALMYNSYENNLLMVNFEIESASVAEANLDAALENTRSGRSPESNSGNFNVVTSMPLTESYQRSIRQKFPNYRYCYSVARYALPLRL